MVKKEERQVPRRAGTGQGTGERRGERAGWDVRDWEVRGRGLGPQSEGAGLTPGLCQPLVPTAGGRWLPRVPASAAPADLCVLGLAVLCLAASRFLRVSVALFIHFSRFVSVSAVSLSCLRFPSLAHSMLWCPRPECLPPRPALPEKDGGAGVLRR